VHGLLSLAILDPELEHGRQHQRRGAPRLRNRRHIRFLLPPAGFASRDLERRPILGNSRRARKSPIAGVILRMDIFRVDEAVDSSYASLG
jgi:hypothetical protein